MLEEIAKNGWVKDKNKLGYTLTPKPTVGEGEIIVLGDARKLCLIKSKYILYHHLFLANYCEERGMQIVFVDNKGIVEYYKDKTAVENSLFGTFVFVNNICVTWYKNYFPNKEIEGTTLLISESFLKECGITLSDEQWDTLARVTNTKVRQIPPLAHIVKQLSTQNFNKNSFDIYLKAKALEAFVLISDYAISFEKESLRKISSKSKLAVKKAINILDETFIKPPLIPELAQQTGVDKKTLIYAFKEIVGMSIHDYITTLKMQKCVSLLKDSDLKIDLIAKKVGYQSKIHLYNAFKSTFNCTPSQMRKYM